MVDGTRVYVGMVDSADFVEASLTKDMEATVEANFRFGKDSHPLHRIPKSITTGRAASLLLRAGAYRGVVEDETGTGHCGGAWLTPRSTLGVTPPPSPAHPRWVGILFSVVYGRQCLGHVHTV